MLFLRYPALEGRSYGDLEGLVLKGNFVLVLVLVSSLNLSL
jgi:hypothetical protein